jgi:hypothetical protein
MAIAKKKKNKELEHVVKSNQLEQHNYDQNTWNEHLKKK